MNLGILGGTFDPVHCGHLAIAEEAQRQIGLEEVIFVPAGRPYFKDPLGISPAQERLKMLELALTETGKFKISLLEIEREGPSYAVDTLLQLRGQYGAGTGLYFILGWDSVMSLPLWRDPRKLLGLCRIVGAPRPGFDQTDLSELEKKLPGITGNLIILTGPYLDISSSDIRRRVRLGLPYADMVPARVSEYIRKKNLYRQAGVAS